SVDIVSFRHLEPSKSVARIIEHQDLGGSGEEPKEVQMQRVALGVMFAVLSMISWSVPDALAQDTKVARGTVVDMGGSWLTVKVRDEQMKFAISSKTVVEARGGSTKTREAAAKGQGDT